MKYFLSILSWIFIFPFTFQVGFSQEVNFENVVIPMDQVAPTFESFLVQLAWLNTPNTDILESEKNFADHNINNKKLTWLRAVGFNLGFNRSSSIVDPDTGITDPIFYPRVSVGASIYLHPLFTTPSEVKMAKEELKITEAALDQEKLRIRKEVKQRYQKHLLALEVVKLRTKMEEDADATYQLMSQLFKKQEVQFEDYNKAYTAYHSAAEGRLEAETEVKLSQLEIEEMIGIDLEDAQQLYKATGKE